MCAYVCEQGCETKREESAGENDAVECVGGRKEERANVAGAHSSCFRPAEIRLRTEIGERDGGRISRVSSFQSNGDGAISAIVAAITHPW